MTGLMVERAPPAKKCSNDCRENYNRNFAEQQYRGFRRQVIRSGVTSSKLNIQGVAEEVQHFATRLASELLHLPDEPAGVADRESGGPEMAVRGNSGVWRPIGRRRKLMFMKNDHRKNAVRGHLHV
jgi:hypothetical protein